MPFALEIIEFNLTSRKELINCDIVHLFSKKKKFGSLIHLNLILCGYLLK
jgi:hypothetical protein